MVAVVSGNGLGLFNTSLNALGAGIGGQASIGQGGNAQQVNVATGNLLLTGWDESLFGRGFSTALTRTYNSQGTVAGAGADGWYTGYEKTVRLVSGTVNTAGSVVERATADGAVQTFTWVAANSRYESSAGDGANDSIKLVGSGTAARWEYTEGSSQVKEKYLVGVPNTTAGNLDSITDLATGATYTFTYDASNRLSVITGANGETMEFGYDSSNRLVSVGTREYDAAGVLSALKSQVTYGYEAATGRLSWVQTDLTPNDGTDNVWDASNAANNDGKRFRTTYTYVDATSLRISNVSTSDGVSVSYTYDANNRVKTVTQGNASDGSAQTLNFAYFANYTEVSDSENRVWTYQYDANGQLTGVLAPTVNNQRAFTGYAYDGAGNVTRITHSAAGVTASDTVFKYDVNGNVILQRDLLGNTVERTYNSANKVLSETVYTVPDADLLDPTFAGTTNLPSGALTTRYVYDASNELVRFIINGAGEVTENQYYTSGTAINQLAVSRRFIGTLYTTAGTRTLAQMTTWIVGKEAQTSRSEVYYDLQGRVSQTVAYANVDATTFAGVLDDSAAITNFTYDAHGLLRQKIAVAGASRTLALVPNGSTVTDYCYDGMGRLLGVTTRDVGAAANDANSIGTSYSYVDSSNQLRVTLDGGSVRVEARNKAGMLINVSETGTVNGSAVTRTTQNVYDAAGRLRAAKDAAGAFSYFFYDEAGRLTATVDGTGAVNRTKYDDNGRAAQTVGYAIRLNTGSWYDGTSVTIETLVYQATAPSLGAKQAWVATDAARDRNTYRTYDDAGRLLTEKDAADLLTTYAYDGASNLLSTTVSKVGDASVTPRITRYFYDANNRQVAVLDAAGYLTESVYDAGGRVITTTRYAKPANSAYYAVGTLAQLKTAPWTADTTNDVVTRFFYNGRDQEIARLEYVGLNKARLTEVAIDEARGIHTTTAYGLAFTVAATDPLLTLHNNAAATANQTTHVTKSEFNALGQLAKVTNSDNVVTVYTYDEAGRLVHTEQAQGTAGVRENFARFDVFGQLVAEMSGEQVAQAQAYALATYSKALTDPLLTPTQLDDIYSRFSTRHCYDAMGRRTDSTDAAGNKTWYFYDEQGRLTFTVKGLKDGNGVQNASAEVTQTRYTAFGQVCDTTAYTGRFVIAAPYDRATVATLVTALKSAALGTSDSRRAYTYDTRGLLATITDAEGKLTQNSYTAFGQLYTTQRGVGTTETSTTRYDYDIRGLQTSTTDTATNVSTSQTYDAFGRVSTRMDGRGTVTTFTYDRLGRQITAAHSSDGVAESESIAYDAFDRIVSTTDANTKTTTYTFNDAAKTVTVRSPEGVTVTTTHNEFGETVSVLRGYDITTYNFDRDGHLVHKHQGGGDSDGFEYDASYNYDPLTGLLMSTVDEAGHTISYSYDAVGRVLTRTEDPGAGHLALVTTYAYDGQGRQVKVTDASGRLTAMAYDREGRLISVARDPNGVNQLTTYTYDAQGRQITVTEGSNPATAVVTKYVYDTLGRRTSEILGFGTLNLTKSYTYDANGNVATSIDELGNVTRYAYNEDNQVRFSIDPLGNTVETAYDKAGNATMTRVYSKPVADPSSITTVALAVTAVGQIFDDTQDVVTYRMFDGDHHEIRTIDGKGGVRATTYDSNGMVCMTVDYTAPVTLTSTLRTNLKKGIATLSLTTSADDVVTYIWHSDDGRVTRRIDAYGNVAETWVDGTGRNIGNYRYVAPLVDFAANTTLKAALANGTASWTDTGAALDVTKDPELCNVYDGAGRLLYTLTGAGSVTLYSYDGAGRVTGTTQYAKAVTIPESTWNVVWMDNYNSIPLVAALVAGQTTPASTNAYDGAGRLVASVDATGNKTRFVYDEAGHLRFTIGADGSVSETRYNAAGQAFESRTYAKALTAASLAALTDTVSLATVSSLVSSQALQNDALDAVSYSVLDAAGQVRLSIDGTGSVTETLFDAAGRAFGTRIYSHAAPVVTLRASLEAGNATYAGLLNSVTGDPDTDQASYAVLDGTGAARFVLDGENGLRETRHDAAGRVYEQLGYTVPVTDATLIARIKGGLAAVSELSTFTTANASTATIAWTVYDGASRARFSIDGLGNTKETRYDLAGRPSEVIGYPSPLNPATYTAGLSAGTTPVATLVTALSSQVDVRATQYVYDAAGRLVYTLQGVATNQAIVTESRYDANGNRIADVRYGKTITYASAMTAKNVSDALAAPPNANDPTLQHLTRFAYDAAGRLRFTVDDTGAVTEQRYDAAGRVTATRQYMTPIASSVAVTEATVAAAVANQNQVQRVDNTYDAAGRLTKVTDTFGQFETYTYDGVGNRTSYTNKAGSIWNYTYDAAGRLLQEESPKVVVARYVGAGLNVPTMLSSIKTAYTYDALGRVLSKTENALTTDSRVTTYAYDARGRQILTTFPKAGQVGDDGKFVAFSGPDGPTIEVKYDALDRAVVQKDVRGNFSYKVYDALGRVAYDIDEAGYVTGYTYDTYGKQKTLTRYASAFDFTKIRSATWTDGNAISLALFNTTGALPAGTNRVVTTTFDRLGRRDTVVQSAVTYYSDLGVLSGTTASPTTKFTYDTYGNLVQESMQLDASTWANTFHYFDDLNREVMTVDAEGYVTAREYDALGNVLQQTEFARAIDASGLSTTSAPLAPPAGDSSTGFDRITRWTYDLLGRKTGETVVHHYQSSTGVAGVRDVTTTTSYDAADHVVKLSVDGVETRTIYDALGRVTAVQEAERDVLVSDAEGKLAASSALALAGTSLYEKASPYTEISYDAFGHAVRTIRYANGLRNGSVTADAARDQVSTVRYDNQGRAVIEINSIGQAIYTRYDAADHAVKSWYRLDGSDGRWQNVTTTADFDALGRQTKSTVTRALYRDYYGNLQDLNKTVTDSVENVVYNAFGEITSKDFGGATSFSFTYDVAGRLVSSNAEGGVSRTYGYNLAGVQVFETHKAFLTGTTVVDANTKQEVDKLGRVTRITLPTFSDTVGDASIINQKLDRWGNVLAVTDANGFLTRYEYNELGQTTREIQPLVRVVDEHGAETWQWPEKNWYYDAMGRLVGERDANAHTKTYEYDPVGQQIRSLDARGKATRMAYDALGNLRLTENPLGYLTYDSFDRLGRVVAHGDFLPGTGTTRNQTVIETYTLNQNGDRLSVKDALGNTSKYDYDGRHLLLRSQTAAGVIMGYTYDSQGRKIREENELSNPEFATYLGLKYKNGSIPTSKTTITGQTFATITIPADAFTLESTDPVAISVEFQRWNASTSEFEPVSDSGLTYNATTRKIEGKVTIGGYYQIVVTATAPGGSTMTRTMSLFAGTSSEVAGIPTANGMGDVTIAKGTALNVSISGFSGTGLTYSVAIRYWVPSTGMHPGAYKNDIDFEDTDYVPAHWEYRALASTDWVKYDPVTNKFTGTPTVGGDTQLEITATSSSSHQSVSTLFTIHVTAPSSAGTTVTDADGEQVKQNEMTWDYDIWGRLTDHNDLSGVDYNYFYNSQSGQATKQTSGWGTSLTMVSVLSELTIDDGTPTMYVATPASTGDRVLSYFTNGLVKQIVEGTSVYNYAYDASGNRILEDSTTYDVNGAKCHIVTKISYDSHNRIERVIQIDQSTSPDKTVLDLTYRYDANGNRRNVIATGAYIDGTPSLSTPNLSAIPLTNTLSYTVKNATTANFSVRVDDLFSDPEGDALTFTPMLVLANGTEQAIPTSGSWLTYSWNDVTDEIVFTSNAALANNGSYKIRVYAKDTTGSGASIPNDVVFNVVTNTGPVLVGSTVPNFNLKVGKDADIELAALTYFKDADIGDALTLTFSGALPPGMSAVVGSGQSVLRFGGIPTAAATYTLSMIATDKSGATKSRSFTITVAANPPPTSAPIPAYSAFTGRAFAWDTNLSNVFNDNSGDSFTVSAAMADGSAWPSWLSFEMTYPGGTPKLALKGTPPTSYADNTVLNVKFTATDPANHTASSTLAITLHANHAPTQGTAPSPLTIRVGKDLSATLKGSQYFVDAEGDQFTLSLDPNNPCSAWLTSSYDAATGILALGGNPTLPAYLGNFTVQVFATDTYGAVTATNVAINVVPDSAPQPGPALPNVDMPAGRNVRITIPAGAFTSLDGDTFTYEGKLEVNGVLQDLPSWLTFDSTGCMFVGIAPTTVGSAYKLVVVATDPAGNQGTQSFLATTKSAVGNAAPAYTANSLTNKTAGEGTPVQFVLPANAFTDLDPLTYSADVYITTTASWVPISTIGLSINQYTGTITGIPGQLTQNTYQVRISASDGAVQTQAAPYTLTINRAPILQGSGIPPQTAVVGLPFSYQFINTFADPEGGNVTYTVSGLPKGLSLSGSGGFYDDKITGTPTQAGDYIVTVTATDNPFSGPVAKATTTFVLSVVQPPKLVQPLPDIGVAKNSTFSVAFPTDSFISSDGSQLSYTAQLKVTVYTTTTYRALPAWLQFDPATRTFSGTPTAVGTFTIRVTATDARGLPATDEFVINVTGDTVGFRTGGTGWKLGGTGDTSRYATGGDTYLMVPPPIDDGANPVTGDDTDPLPAPGTNVSKGYWYTYDEDNRVVVVNGSLANVGANIELAASDSSYALAYDNAGRVSNRTVLISGAKMLEVSQYDTRGQLTYVFQPITVGTTTPPATQAGALKEARYYDVTGRLMQQVDYYGTGETRNGIDIKGWRASSDTYEYNADGQVIRQVTRGRVLGWNATSGQSITTQSGDSVLSNLSEVNTRFDVIGRSSGYTYSYFNHAEDYTGSASDATGFTHTYGITYQGRDGYLELQVKGTSSNSTFRASTSQSVYDGWGRRIAIREQTPIPKKWGTLDDRIRYFSYDGEDKIMRRREGTLNSSNAFTQTDDQKKKDMLYSYANGQQVAEQSRSGTIELRTKLTAYQEGAGRLSSAADGLTDYETNELGAATVTVNSGDSLQTIAQRVYGNSGLWYVIAGANALTSNAELVPGTSLKVPNVRVAENDASTFKPYNPGEIIGNTAPGLPYITPPKQQSHNCGMILVMIVAVVVTAIVAPYATQFVAQALSSVGVAVGAGTVGGFVAGVAGAFVGGMAGSIASQVVGKAVGVVDHFSLRQAVGEGITDGLTFGLNKLGVAEQLAKLFGSTRYALAASRAVLSTLSGYAGNKIAGVSNTSFSWKSVAASAVSAAITSGVMEAIQMPDANSLLPTDPKLSPSEALANGFVSGVVSQHVRRAFGFSEPINYATALGQGLAAAAGNVAGKWADDSAAKWSDRHAPWKPVIDWVGYFGGLSESSLAATNTGSQSDQGYGEYHPLDALLARNSGMVVLNDSKYASDPRYRPYNGGWVKIEDEFKYYEQVEAWDKFLIERKFADVPTLASFQIRGMGADKLDIYSAYHHGVIDPVMDALKEFNQNPNRDQILQKIEAENNRLASMFDRPAPGHIDPNQDLYDMFHFAVTMPAGFIDDTLKLAAKGIPHLYNAFLEAADPYGLNGLSNLEIGEQSLDAWDKNVDASRPTATFFRTGLNIESAIFPYSKADIARANALIDYVADPKDVAGRAGYHMGPIVIGTFLGTSETQAIRGGFAARDAALFGDAEGFANANVALGLADAARKAEPGVTMTLSDIAAANGGGMLGLDYRFKSVESITRKLATQPVGTPVNDALRYTMSFEEATFTPGVETAMSTLEEQGYELQFMRNTFRDGRPYKGINATYLTPEGGIFELQFHTPESFYMKDVINHPIYEQWRLLPNSDPARLELQSQMIRNSANVSNPPGVSSIR